MADDEKSAETLSAGLIVLVEADKPQGRNNRCARSPDEPLVSDILGRPSPMCASS